MWRMKDPAVTGYSACHDAAVSFLDSAVSSLRTWYWPLGLPSSTACTGSESFSLKRRKKPSLQRVWSMLIRVASNDKRVDSSKKFQHAKCSKFVVIMNCIEVKALQHSPTQTRQAFHARKRHLAQLIKRVSDSIQVDGVRQHGLNQHYTNLRVRMQESTWQDEGGKLTSLNMWRVQQLQLQNDR